MSSLVIVNSGSANLRSIYKAAESLSLRPVVSEQPGEIARAGAIIFPGVGSFAHTAKYLENKGMNQALLEVVARGRPFLGVCLGMQLLFSSSEETAGAGLARGLNALDGTVKRFPPGRPVPHVGWNRATPVEHSPLFHGLENGAYFYFTHSFYVEPAAEGTTLAVTEYGFSFTSAIAEKGLYGVQFHPEKSGFAGLRLLGNFGKIIADQG